MKRELTVEQRVDRLAHRQLQSGRLNRILRLLDVVSDLVQIADDRLQAFLQIHEFQVKILHFFGDLLRKRVVAFRHLDAVDGEIWIHFESTSNRLKKILPQNTLIFKFQNLMFACFAKHANTKCAA